MENTTPTSVPTSVPAHVKSSDAPSPVSVKTATTHVAKHVPSKDGKAVVVPRVAIEDENTVAKDDNVHGEKLILPNAAAATVAEALATDKSVSTSQVTVDLDEKVEGSVEAAPVVEHKAAVDANASSSPKTLTEPMAVAASAMGPATSSNLDTAPIEPAPAASPIAFGIPAVLIPSAHPTTTGPNHASSSAIMNYGKSASLYVGDLHPEVGEAALHDVFQGLGPIQSIRVCRDLVTRRSLGYAYLNFVAAGDAERALESMNFYEGPQTRNRPLRLMWKLRDPAQRRTGEGNIFVKGLDHSIDNKTLFDTFSQFGAILSSKIALDEARQSLGYGFVHFESPAAAAEAIRQVNGMLIKGKKVTVQRFLRKSERDAAGHSRKTFTNLYIKQLAESRCNEQGLREIFETFGRITSIHVPMRADGTAMGYAFVNFESYIAAQKAVAAMDSTEVDGKILYVNRAQKRSERQAQLRENYARIRRERDNKRQGSNLYIKNISEDVTEQVLREKFSPYGAITSCAVMKDNNGVSRGFGFVCFSRREEATTAITELNGQTIGAKAIYVAFAQRRDERRHRIRTQRQRSVPYGGSNLFVPGAMYGHPSPQQTPYMFHPNMGHSLAMTPLSFPVQGMDPTTQHSPIPVGAPKQIQQVHMPHHRQGPVYMPAHLTMPQMPFPMPNGQIGFVGANPMVMSNTNNTHRHPRRNRVRAMHHHQMHHQNASSVAGPVNMRNNTGNPRPTAVAPAAVPAQIPQEPLTVEMLTAATPEERTELLGVRLFPLIQKLNPERAMKITGMILELDVPEVLDMLETPDALSSRVAEAVKVLHHSDKVEEEVEGPQNEECETPDGDPESQVKNRHK